MDATAVNIRTNTSKNDKPFMTIVTAVTLVIVREHESHMSFAHAPCIPAPGFELPSTSTASHVRWRLSER